MHEGETFQEEEPKEEEPEEPKENLLKQALFEMQTRLSQLRPSAEENLALLSLQGRIMIALKNTETALERVRIENVELKTQIKNLTEGDNQEDKSEQDDPTASE